MPVAQRELRELFPHELRCGVDPASMEEVFARQSASLNEDYRAAQEGQIDELVAAVEAAAGDPIALTQIACVPVDPAMVAAHLQDTAAEGVFSARAEYDHQLPDGPEPLPVDGPEIEALCTERAIAVCLSLASSLSGSASKRALANHTLGPASLGLDVREFLEGLKGVDLDTQLSGATTAAFNIGRNAFFHAQTAPLEAAPAATMGPTARAGRAPLRAASLSSEGGSMILAVYASEVMDENTCGPCAEIDGREYYDVASGEEDYPGGGGMIDCEGGLRCRGTLVVEWGTYGTAAPEPPGAREPGQPSGSFSSMRSDIGNALTELAKDEWGPLQKQASREIRDQGDRGINVIGPAADEAVDQIDALVRLPKPPEAGEIISGGMTGNRNALAAMGAENANHVPRLFFNARHLIDDKGSWRLNTVHELGHRLDNLVAMDRGAGAPPKPHWSTLVADAKWEEVVDPEFVDLIDTIKASRETTFLAQQQAKAKAGRPIVFNDPAFLDYALEDRELFARAFSQFVATEHADTDAIDFALNAFGPGMHWDPDNFAPIHEKMKAWLQAKDLWKGAD